MRYGRTIVEVIFAQLIILAALMLVPTSLVTSMSDTAPGILGTAIPAAIAALLYLRHSDRIKTSGRRFAVFGLRMRSSRTTVGQLATTR